MAPDTRSAVYSLHQIIDPTTSQAANFPLADHTLRGADPQNRTLPAQVLGQGQNVAELG